MIGLFQGSVSPHVYSASVCPSLLTAAGVYMPYIPCRFILSFWLSTRKCLHAFMLKYILFLIQSIAAEPVFILCLKGLFKFWLVTALTGLSKHLPTMCTHHKLCWRCGWVWWLYSYDITTWSFKRHTLGILALYIQCFPQNSFWGWWVTSWLTLNRRGCFTISSFTGGM